MIKFIIFFYLCSIGINCANTTEPLKLSTDHLPLSNWLKKKFPKIQSKYFIISNPEVEIVVHEQNSNTKLRCGSFSKVILSIAILKKYRTIQYVNKHNLYKYNNDKTKLIEDFLLPFGRGTKNSTDIALCNDGAFLSLYEMCNIFSISYEYLKQHTDLMKVINKNLHCIFFYSERDGAGCAFRYKNNNNCVFDCVIFGVKDKEELSIDIKKICDWLNIFVVNNITREYSITTNVSVFYGKSNKLPILLDCNSKILMVKNRPEKVSRKIRYLMRIRAPVHQSDTIGWVFYKTSLFDNPIKYTLKSKQIIKKGGIFNNLLDSIHYIIYNRPRRT
ncbi:MAG: hypothetical protein IJ848_03460 [Alphaproteobacteria bacterium]|nr:hypothetical protein [Alphaproteobacteria bacterium]